MSDAPTIEEIHLGMDMLDVVWIGNAWCDPLTLIPWHACADCRPLSASQETDSHE